MISVSSCISMIKKQGINILSALLINSIFLGCMLLHFTESKHHSTAGNFQTKIIHTYLYQYQLPHKIWHGKQRFNKQHASQKPQYKKVVQKSKLALPKRHGQYKEKQAQQRYQSHKSKTSQKQTMPGGGQRHVHGTSELLTLLHKIIQQHQHYPQQAWQNGISGTTMVTFQLRPNGDITTIHLLQSSGHSSLDRAAIKAVAASAPISNANHYINQDVWLAIPIQFSVN